MMFLCTKCPKIFLDKKQLAYHQTYHVKFAQKNPTKHSLITHSTTHKSDLFSCGECSKTYKHQASSISHQRLDYGGISCSFCDLYN